jgi:tRNA threonylcarbamoyladenosine modification (KEOPS) complex  Pcc1 subunit
MSRPGSPFELIIKIRGDRDFLKNISSFLSNSSSQRVKINVRHSEGLLSIDIKAADFNILLAVNNSIMQSLKMIEEVNLYG